MNFLKGQGTPVGLFQEHLFKENKKILPNNVKKSYRKISSIFS